MVGEESVDGREVDFDVGLSDSLVDCRAKFVGNSVSLRSVAEAVCALIIGSHNDKRLVGEQGENRAVDRVGLDRACVAHESEPVGRRSVVDGRVGVGDSPRGVVRRCDSQHGAIVFLSQQLDHFLVLCALTLVEAV